MSVLKAFQGRQYNRNLQLNNLSGLPTASVFNASSILACNVWEGQNQVSLFQPIASWLTSIPATPTTPAITQTGYDQGQIALSIAASQTANLDPAGWYSLLIDVTTGGTVYPGWQGRLAILATPGSTSPAPPDLATYDYVLSQLSVLSLTDDQLDTIPYLITAASQAWRLECNDRNFDLRTLTEWYEPELDGQVRLWQTPVQIVTRVQGIPRLALTIFNTSAQSAQAYFSFTGEDGGFGSNAKTATGITLNSTADGIFSTQTVLFATAGPTIGQLATAINAVGSGWQAQVTSTFSPWACTELTGGFVSQGCTPNDFSSGGARFRILEDMPGARLRPRSPMLFVGRQRGGNMLAERFGPGGYEFFGNDGEDELGLVRVTYQAGYAVIPQEIQYQVAQLVKWKLELGVQELLLKSEKAADYEYDLAEEMVSNMPKSVRDAAGRWKAHYA